MVEKSSINIESSGEISVGLAVVDLYSNDAFTLILIGEDILASEVVKNA